MPLLDDKGQPIPIAYHCVSREGWLIGNWRGWPPKHEQLKLADKMGYSFRFAYDHPDKYRFDVK